jgi:hypothetical protein
VKHQINKKVIKVTDEIEQFAKITAVQSLNTGKGRSIHNTNDLLSASVTCITKCRVYLEKRTWFIYLSLRNVNITVLL